MGAAFEGEKSTSKLEVAKSSILMLLARMKPTDNFCLLTFNSVN
jgi:hypothetical protein